MEPGRGKLLAVLLNPASGTTGKRTQNAVAVAAGLLGLKQTEIVNLCSTATPSVVELNWRQDAEGWAVARSTITQALAGTGTVLGAWGIAGLTGAALAAKNEQVDWLLRQLALVGIEEVWMVGGEPRHPSRWHQYVADRHGRTSGGTFSERLAQVLRPVAIHGHLTTAWLS